MLEEDPAEITVRLVQFEKDVPFCMPGAEGTFVNAFVVGTRLRRGGHLGSEGVHQDGVGGRRLRSRGRGERLAFAQS